MAEPLVSIIIPVYNAEKYLAETILSAIGQTWHNKEIIIVNDGSTDNSFTIAKTYESNNVIILSQPNKGASVARNYGLMQAKGKYIQFLDADDILSPDKIQSQVEILNNSDEFLAVCNTVHFSGEQDYKTLPVVNEWFAVGSDDPVDFLLKLYAGEEIIPGYGGMVQPNAWLTPRKLIDKAGMWNEFRCPDDDGEFFCRVILAGKGVKFSNKGVNYYRKYTTGGSLSGQKNLEAMQNRLLSLDLKYGYLKNKTDITLLKNIFARHYWDLGVAAYPQHKKISQQAIKKAKEFNYKGRKYYTSKIAALLSLIIGWRFVKLISYYKHR